MAGGIGRVGIRILRYLWGILGEKCIVDIKG